MNNPENIKILISAYIDGEVTAEEKAQVEEILRTNEELRQYHRSLLNLSGRLKAVELPPLSPDGEQTIKEKIQREGNTMKTQSRTIALRMGGSLVTAAVVLIIGVQVYNSMLFKKFKTSTDDIGATFSSGKTAVAPPQKESISKTAAISSQPATVAQIPQEKTEQYEPYNLKSSYKTTADAVVARQRSAGGFQAQEIASLENVQQEFWGAAPAAAPVENVAQGLVIYPMPIVPSDKFNTEEYSRISDNPFLNAIDNPLSTFSIDVDTASYSNLRRFLQSGQLPPKDAVRIEEMVNYFDYEYPQPKEGEPFSITTEVNTCPWNAQHNLVLIGLKGKELAQTPPSNLVFLVDVSGSMDSPDKLPLLKEGFKLMVNQLNPQERVAIVTYAGAAGLVLESTPASEKDKILRALDNLQAGGSTAGGEGIQLAYKVAKENLIAGGNNRVILATDGDFNVGVSSDGELTRIIEEKRKEGVFLTVLGFGTGNYKDSKMEQLADKGNGNYYYIDTRQEANKVLVRELGSMLFTIAKDVKIQIEFNPQAVKSYRLIGYENRMLAKEDFNDDTKDAGELGSGHTVTALYEVVPAGTPESVPSADELKYQKVTVKPSNDLLTVKLRYKQPDREDSRLLTKVLPSTEIVKPNELRAPSMDYQWAAAVAEFGLILRDSPHKGQADIRQVINRAQAAQGEDHWGYCQEMVDLMKTAEPLLPTANGSYQYK